MGVGPTAPSGAWFVRPRAARPPRAAARPAGRVSAGDGPGLRAAGTPYDGADVPLRGAHPRNARPTLASPVSGGEPVHPRREADAEPAVPHPFEPTHLGGLPTAGPRTVYGFTAADLAVAGEGAGRVVLDDTGCP